MAEKGFGVKEINLIGASGTPTIESPNNLNLNAVNVAISTNATIGGNLTVTGNIGIAGTLTYEDVTNIDSIGIVTAREGIVIPDSKVLALGNRVSGSTLGDLRLYHDGSNSYIDEIGSGNLYVRNGSNNSIYCQTSGTVQLFYNGNDKLSTTNTGVSVSGTLAATAVTGDGSGLTNVPGATPADTDVQITFDVSASGSSGYIFTGPGNDGSTVDPDIFLIRGQRYRFINTTGSSHPFEFRNSDNSADFTDGITGSQSGTQDFNVQYDAPSHLKYRCTVHSGMIGNIYIRSGADTGASAGTGNLEVDGFLRFDNTISKILTDTSDGSDDKSIFICGGGDVATSRGALAILYGNELNSGRLDLYAGVGGGAMTFNTGTTTTERLRITSSGNVGIQTADPKAFFHASRPSTAAVTLNFGDPVAQILQCEDSEFALGLHNASPYPLYIQGRTRTNAARQIVLNPLGGNIGIGTINPTTNLQVNHATNECTISLYNGGTKKAALQTQNSFGTILYSYDNEPLKFSVASGTSYSEKLRIAGNGDITVTSIDANATGPTLKLFHNSASPAANDVVSRISMFGDDSAGNETEYGRIETVIDDTTNGQETGHINFAPIGYSVNNTVFRIKRRGSASAPSYTTDDADGIILDVYNTGNPYTRYMNFIAKSSGNTDSNIGFWTEAVGGSPTERLRIDSNGKLGLGMNSSQQTALKGKLDIDASGIDAAGDTDDPNDYAIVIRNSSTTNQGNGIAFTNDSGQHVGGAIIHIDKGSNNLGDLAFYTAATSSTPVERLRIESDGQVIVTGSGTRYNGWAGGTPLNVTSMAMVNVGNADTNNWGWGLRGNSGDTQWCLERIKDNTSFNDSYIKFRVYNNGNYLFAGTNSSDRNLKENILDITGTSLDKIKQLRPRTFNFIESEGYSNETKTGFIAQEVASVIPSITNGTDGQKNMGVDYNGLVAHLVKAVQELKAENDSLKARIAALEGS